MSSMILVCLYCFIFAALTWYRFGLGLFFLFLLLPTYLIRFAIGPIPTTLLEVMLIILLIVWFVKEKKSSNWRLKIRDLITNHQSLLIAISLFLLGATISVFTAVDLRSAAGEWKAFYVEPVVVFLVLVVSLCVRYEDEVRQESKKTRRQENDFFKAGSSISSLQSLIFALVLLGLATGILATIQKFTGWMVPWDFWENRNSYRVTGWYGFPNGVGLFLAPVALLAGYVFMRSLLLLGREKLEIRDWRLAARSNLQSLISIAISFLSIIFSLLGIIFAKSTAGLIGVAAGIGLLLVFYRKTRCPVIVLGLLAIVGVFSLPADNAIRQELLAQNRSGQLRVDMWAEATQYLSEHPIAGAGLASYTEVIYPYRVDKWIEVFHHPHNLFLTMWVNTGIIGLVGFLWVIVWFYRVGLAHITYHVSRNNRSQQSRLLVLFLLAAMASILVTGLVDSPYIKNDYSLLFWFLVAGMVIVTKNQYIQKAKK